MRGSKFCARTRKAAKFERKFGWERCESFGGWAGSIAGRSMRDGWQNLNENLGGSGAKFLVGGQEALLASRCVMDGLNN